MRYKFSNLVAINAEYHYNLNNNIDQTHNFFIGFDIETGGHIFNCIALILYLCMKLVF